MSADPMMGIDPETQEPMEMPQDGQMPPELLEQLGQGGPGVDPNSPSPDPMLQQEPDHDEPDAYAIGTEVEKREAVELDLLNAICRAAKGVEIGEGAANPQFAQAYAQAAASLAQAYEALTRTEQSASAPPAPPSL